MQRLSTTGLVLLLMLGLPATSSAVVDFVLDVQPLSLLVSPEADGFSASNGVMTEEIDGTGSVMPGVKLGLGIDVPFLMYVDVTVGGGRVMNDAFTVWYGRGDIAGRFKLGPIVTLGPHVGVLKFQEPEWEEEADLDFSDTTGFIGGVELTLGKLIYFYAAVDYVQASFDVEGKNGWVTDEDELDLSGLAFQLGVQGRF